MSVHMTKDEVKEVIATLRWSAGAVLMMLDPKHREECIKRSERNLALALSLEEQL